MSKNKKKVMKENPKEVKNYFHQSQRMNLPKISVDDDEYEALLDEIAYYQYKMYKEDRKVLSARKKKIEKTKQSAFFTSPKQLQVRREIIQEAAKNGGLFDRVLKYLAKISPLVQQLGLICAKFICTILKIDRVKRMVNRSLLEKIDMVYQICVSL